MNGKKVVDSEKRKIVKRKKIVDCDRYGWIADGSIYPSRDSQIAPLQDETFNACVLELDIILEKIRKIFTHSMLIKLKIKQKMLDKFFEMHASRTQFVNGINLKF